jgi:hypothetical protein
MALGRRGGVEEIPRRLLPAFAARSLAQLITRAARRIGESQSSAAHGPEFPPLPILATAG